MNTMTIAEQHAKVEKLIAQLPDSSLFHEVLGLDDFKKTVKTEYTGSAAIPSNRRTASKRRGNE